MDRWKVAEFRLASLSGGRQQSRRLRRAHNEGTARLHRTFFKLWNAPIMEEHGAVRCEKLRQMDTTAESNHTSYSVSAGHPPVSCVCFSTSFCNRRQGQQLKQLHVRWALGTTLVLHWLSWILTSCLVLIMTSSSRFAKIEDLHLSFSSPSSCDIRS